MRELWDSARNVLAVERESASVGCWCVERKNDRLGGSGSDISLDPVLGLPVEQGTSFRATPCHWTHAHPVHSLEPSARPNRQQVNHLEN